VGINSPYNQPAHGNGTNRGESPQRSTGMTELDKRVVEFLLLSTPREHHDELFNRMTDEEIRYAVWVMNNWDPVELLQKMNVDILANLL
jgi:hypothetical protein